MVKNFLFSFALMLGNWSVKFDESNSWLQLENLNGGVEIGGSLAFTSDNQRWHIVAPRDAVTNRVAILNNEEEVQGYLSFQQNGESLSLLVTHRTAQSYQGNLEFKGEIKFTPDSFACRTQPLKKTRVIQFGSGNPDTTLNDSLFDPELDRCLLITATEKRILTQHNGNYTLYMSSAIHESSEAAWNFNIEDNYLQSRYVPYYAPINRKRCPSPPTGWMSWNVYFDKATAEDNLKEARTAKEHLQPFGMEFWSIESWQEFSDQLPVSNFDNLSLKPNPRQFPLGMKKLADDIRELGFRPGIWTAPFGTGCTNFYTKHKSWFLHDKNGTPLRTWNGKFTIDPSNDDVIAHLREIHRIASHEWGYEFFKIDGMSGQRKHYCAHFFEIPDVRACFANPDCPNPFERCVNAFRDGIGDDRIFLACQGHFSGPEAAVADAARIGGDIVAPNKPSTWNNLLHQANKTLNQAFVNNIVFYNDPDTLLVDDGYRTLEEARLATTVVALPGQMMFAGDKLSELTPDRMRLLQQSLPVCNVKPLDLFPLFDLLPIWALHIRRPFAEWHVVALYNWEEADKEIEFTFDEIGISSTTDYALYEFWSASYLGVHKNEFKMTVPRHGVSLLALHKKQTVPQFISSDRHITQGAVELTELAWNASKKELRGTVQLVQGSPLTLRFLIPENYKFIKAATNKEITHHIAWESSHQLLALTLNSPNTQETTFILEWE